MKSILIHTIGNRDLQFKPYVPSIFQAEYLEKNKEKGFEDFWVIKRGHKDSKQSFNSFSRRLLGHLGEQKEGYKSLLDNLCFPMLDEVLAYARKKEGKRLDRLLICATQQAEPHAFDTNYVAEIIERYYGAVGFWSDSEINNRADYKRLKNHYLTIEFDKGQEPIIEDCFDLLQSLKKEGFTRFYISNQTGLPAVSQAFNFVGYFQNYTYLSVHSKKGVQEVNRKVQERILSSLVKDKIIKLIEDAKL